jgi:Transposase, Mutator family
MFHPTKAAAWVKAKLSPGVRINNEADPAELQKLLWTGIEEKLQQYLKALIEQLLEAEIDRYLGAKRYERSETRKDYRNGSYARSLGTRHGAIPDVRVPRVRSGAFDPKVFDRYERRSKSVDQLIGTLFLNGISTRKLERIAKELLGTDVSHSTVSRVAGEIASKDCLQFPGKRIERRVPLPVPGRNFRSHTRDFGGARRASLRARPESRRHEGDHRRAPGGFGKRKGLGSVPNRLEDPGTLREKAGARLDRWRLGRSRP